MRIFRAHPFGHCFQHKIAATVLLSRVATLTCEKVKANAQRVQRVPPSRLFDCVVELRNCTLKLILRQRGPALIVPDVKLRGETTAAVIPELANNSIFVFRDPSVAVPEPAGLGGGGGGGRGYVGHLVACLDGTFIPRLFGPDRDMLRLLLLNHRSAREDANPPGKKSPFLSLFPIFGRRKKKRCKKSRRSSASTKFNSASLSSAAACSRSHLEYATVAHGRIPPFFASALPCTAIFFGKRPLSKKMPAPKKRQRPALDYEAPG